MAKTQRKESNNSKTRRASSDNGWITIHVKGTPYEMGFQHAAVGAMVRSSYHADQQAAAALLPKG